MTWLTNPYRFGAASPGTAGMSYWRVSFHGSNGDAVWLAEAEMAATAGGADMCTVGNGTASSGGGVSGGNFVVSGAAGIFDNDNGTSSFGKWPDEAWFQWQFLTDQTVAELRLRGPAAGQLQNQPLGVTVRGSSDGVTWQLFGFYTGLTWVADETKTFAISPTALTMTGLRSNARAWRMNVTENQGGSVVQVGEIIFAASPGGSAVAHSGYVSSGGFGAFGRIASSAFDGDTTTQWSTGTVNDHGRIGAVLTTPGDIQEVRACRGNQADADGAPYDFTVEWTEDCATWNVAATFTAITGWSAGTYKTFSVP